MERENTQMDSHAQTSSFSSSPCADSSESPICHNPNSAPRYGTVIPNRIFVGGFDLKTTEQDLYGIFSEHGVVKEVKIVNDRAGIPKGYGFVTFETNEDAQRILTDIDELHFRGRKLNIAQAIRKQQVGIQCCCPDDNVSFLGSNESLVPSGSSTMYMTTSNGYPYTYHNGMAYFPTPETATVTHIWPVPVPTLPIYYFQTSDTAYQSMERAQDCAPAASAVPGLDTIGPEDSFDVAVADFAELRTDNPIPGRSPHVPLCCQRIHERPGPLAVMGCGLRKLEDPDDSSPGKIYSTLKRAQVETKSDAVYEYTLLDFSLEGSTNPEIIRISSLRDITCELEQHYRKGFVLATLHPVVLSVGRKRQLPLSLLYRAVLSRRRPSSKYAASAGPGTPRLLIEEWPLPGETLTSEVVSCLLDKVNICGQRGMRFLGFVPQQSKGTSQTCNGGVPSPKPSSRGSPNGQSSESGIEDDPLQENGAILEGGLSGRTLNRTDDTRLFALFHIWDTGYPAWTAPDEDHPRWTYHQGALSMKVTRKGQMISGLEADWLELTTSYYKKGWSLIDSFVYWETRKGEPVPRSLEGLFVYEEGRGCNEPTQGNDTIVVEQWTVIEGSEVKTDYGPLIHTLAEFGWLLTSVLPTPIIRHDSDGNLCTKQVVFLQRPVGGSSSEPRPLRQEKLASQSPHPEVSPHTVSRGVGGASRDVFGAGDGDFSSFGGYPNMLKDLEEVGYEQEEGASEVTCM
ncbi:raftlin-2 isoform X2 [Polypterus senegalus]|uniref:raftlin-2 isoform X2 n=1 Tax=Polypterus senegalus TaxID=55291 RepID=UPI0019623642|nr:raftlin-2 isoform X2 [Polypterus senegalus]